MSLKINLDLNLRVEHSKSIGLGSVYNNFTLSRGHVLGDGTEDYSADTIYQGERALAYATSETLDVNDGSLTDSFGDSVTLATLKAIYVKNNSDDASLLIGGAAANQIGLFNDVSDILKLRPGGEILLTSPDDNGVDVSTNSELKFEHDGTGTDSLTYEIIISGDAVA